MVRIIQWSPLETALVAVGRGFAIGMFFGILQWLELKRNMPSAARWIWANILAWIPGMVIISIGLVLFEEGGTYNWLVAGAASALLGGLVIGAITGVFLTRMREARA